MTTNEQRETGAVAAGNILPYVRDCHPHTQYGPQCLHVECPDKATSIRV